MVPGRSEGSVSRLPARVQQGCTPPRLFALYSRAERLSDTEILTPASKEQRKGRKCKKLQSSFTVIPCVRLNCKK